MIKYLLIVFNSFILFLFGIFNADNGITVTSTIPATMIAGKEVAVELTVNKGTMSGFAKLQMELPAGFSVKDAEEKGATYTFNEGIAKWVWAVLPSENEFTLKLILIPSAENIGTQTLRVKYSYVENNVKQVVEMNPAKVTITAEASSGSEMTAPVLAKDTLPPNPVAVNESTVTNLPTPVTSNTEKPGSIVLKRSINRLSATDYEVEIRIHKGSTKGFARYSDLLPQDVVIKSSKTDGASYSLADGKIKFVWVNVPEKDTLVVSYIITSKRAQVVELEGEYTYLEDNQSKKQEIEAQSLAFETPTGTEKSPNPTVEPVAAAEKKEKKALKKPAEKKPVIAEPSQKVATETKKSKTKLKQKALPESAANPVAMTEGTFYQVQIGAFSKQQVTTAKLEKRFNIAEPINSEMAAGFTKFMVGSHKEYKEARDHREKMIEENKIKSSFVVAYNNGKRITVQEALSITNQKWYK